MCGNGFHHGAGCSRHRLPFLKCLGPCLRLEDPLYHPSQGAGRLRPSQPAQTSGNASHHTSFLPQPLRDPAPAVALPGISSPGRQFRGHGKQVGPSSSSLQGVAGGKAQKVALLGPVFLIAPAQHLVMFGCSTSWEVCSIILHPVPTRQPHSFSSVFNSSNTTLPFLVSGPLHRLLLLPRMSFPCLLSSSCIWLYLFIFQVSS